MYNEAEQEIEFTMRGILQNYAEMREDPRLKLGDEEMYAIVLCDGHDKIPQSFKKFARDRGFYDEQRLVEDGYMKHVNGQCKMRRMDEMFDGFQSFGHEVELAGVGLERELNSRVLAGAGPLGDFIGVLDLPRRRRRGRRRRVSSSRGWLLRCRFLGRRRWHAELGRAAADVRDA